VVAFIQQLARRQGHGRGRFCTLCVDAYIQLRICKALFNNSWSVITCPIERDLVMQGRLQQQGTLHLHQLPCLQEQERQQLASLNQLPLTLPASAAEPTPLEAGVTPRARVSAPASLPEILWLHLQGSLHQQERPHQQPSLQLEPSYTLGSRCQSQDQSAKPAYNQTAPQVPRVSSQHAFLRQIPEAR
jgi:hypothetical protein